MAAFASLNKQLQEPGLHTARKERKETKGRGFSTREGVFYKAYRTVKLDLLESEP